MHRRSWIAYLSFFSCLLLLLPLGYLHVHDRLPQVSAIRRCALHTYSLKGGSATGKMTLPSECVSLNRPGFEDLIHPRHRRGGGNVGIGFIDRSEERRVGKECRSRWSPYH